MTNIFSLYMTERRIFQSFFTNLSFRHNFDLWLLLESISMLRRIPVVVKTRSIVRQGKSFSRNNLCFKIGNRVFREAPQSLHGTTCTFPNLKKKSVFLTFKENKMLVIPTFFKQIHFFFFFSDVSSHGSRYSSLKSVFKNENV